MSKSLLLKTELHAHLSDGLEGSSAVQQVKAQGRASGSRLSGGKGRLWKPELLCRCS